MDPKYIKIIAWITIIIAIANILLFALRVYKETVMWGVIIIIALIAFPGMKFLSKHQAITKKTMK